MNADDVVLSRTDNGVTVITLNRPGVRNAMSAGLRAKLSEAVATFELDNDADVAVLTGADPAFCAGLDLKEFGVRTDVRPPTFARGPLPPRTKPLIGAINGVAVTGGLELALACDFLIASERAAFADTHARVGVMPGWGLTVMLPEAIGVRRARQMSTTGNYVDAKTALTWGLINEVVAHDQLLDRAIGLARDIITNDRAGVRRMLKTYAELDDGDANAAWEREVRVSKEWQLAPDRPGWESRREGIFARGRTQTGAQTGARAGAD